MSGDNEIDLPEYIFYMLKSTGQVDSVDPQPTTGAVCLRSE
jgi:hypothetical protein